MKYCRLYLIIGVLLCSAVLSACQQKNKSDAKKNVLKLVKQVEDASRASEFNKLNKPLPIISVVYDGSHSRNPFELPDAIKNIKEYPNTILREGSIESVKLIGIVLNNKERWAIIRAKDGRVYKISEGMRVGMQQALLTQISQDAVKFSIDDSGTDEGKRDIVMTIEEPKQ